MRSTVSPSSTPPRARWWRRRKCTCSDLTNSMSIISRQKPSSKPISKTNGPPLDSCVMLINCSQLLTCQAKYGPSVCLPHPLHTTPSLPQDHSDLTRPLSPSYTLGTPHSSFPIGYTAAIGRLQDS